MAVDAARERMLTFREGSSRRALRIGSPTEPVAPARRTFLMVEDMVKIIPRSDGANFSLNNLVGSSFVALGFELIAENSGASQSRGR